MRKRNNLYLVLYIIVCGVRVVTPFLIFYTPLEAILINLFLDMLDGEFASRKALTQEEYEVIDKIIDLWWYSVVLIYALVVYGVYSRIFLLLYIYRFVGEIAYFITRKRIVLFYFPNLFENTFLLVFFYRYFTSLNLFDSRYLYTYISVAFFLKLFQEYILHINNFSFAETFLGMKKKWL